MSKIYELTINENDETRVEYNSFVGTPAHMKQFIAFKDGVHYEFNEEKRIVTGVMISADTLIPRNDPNIGYHEVFFSADTIERIRKKFMLEGRNHNVNKDHNMKAVTNGAIMIDSYLIGGDKNPKVPAVFESMDLQPGTWIASYFIKDNKLWKEVKEGKFNGFSVEGYFNREKINFKKDKMKKKSIFESFFGKKNDKANEKFETVETTDGTVLNYEGELAVDTPVFVETTDDEGNVEMTPATAGDYQITMDDTVMVVTVNDEGIVSAIEEVTEEDMKTDAKIEDLKTDVVETMSKFTEEMNARFEAIETENKELKEKNEKLEEFVSNLTNEKGEKFSSKGKKAGKEKKKTYRDLLNKK